MNAHTPVADATAQQAPAPKKPERRSLLSMGIARFAEPAPVQEWAVKGPGDVGGLIPAKEPILLIGRGGIGKTSAAVELALKVAAWDGTGTAPTWMGQPIASHGVSVVLTYEESTPRMHRAIQKTAQAAGVDPAKVADRMVVKSFQDVDVAPMPLVGNDPQTRQPVPTAEYRHLTQELRALRDEVGQIGCIVVDNAGTAFAVEGNDYQSANQAMKWLQRWAAEFGALVILVAHTNKGALKFDSDLPSDDELESAAMGSTGWISAVRLAMVMWSLSEDGEAKIAKALDDKEFEPGVTRRRYIRAKVVKSNVDDAYTGTLTLKRAGGTLEDVGRVANRAMAASIAADADNKLAAFAAAVGRAWAAGTPVQKSGKHGVFEHRGVLGLEFAGASKGRLQGLVDQAIAAGAVRVEPMALNGEAGRWLYDRTGFGVREACDRALRSAQMAKKANHRLPEPTWQNVSEWRHHCPAPIAALSDEEVSAALCPPGAKPSAAA